MKKILALVLASLMLVACVACGSNNDDTTVDNTVTDAPATDAPETDAPETDAPAVEAPVAENALEIVNKIFDSFTKEEKIENYFGVEDEGVYYSMIGGGYGDNMNFEGPGNHPVNDQDSREAAINLFHFNDAVIDMIDGEIAMAMNSMASRNLTVACFRVAESADVDMCAAEVKSALLNAQWGLCGSPEKMTVIVIGDYILSVYGINPQIDMVANRAVELYDMAEVIVSEPIL